MASLDIPDRVIEGFTKIATLPEESFRELLSALENIPLKIVQHGVFDESAITPTGIEPDDLKSIRDALFPLYRGRGSGKMPASRYANDITESLKDVTGEESAWLQSEETSNRFKERLLQLLGVSTAQLIAKAHDILLEHAQTFSSARIVSDIRPVFGESVEAPPTAAVIVHMLNLVYFQAGERQEFVVALDTKDIQLLLDTLERAAKKTKSLESLIASTGMTYMEVV